MYDYLVYDLKNEQWKDYTNPENRHPFLNII